MMMPDQLQRDRLVRTFAVIGIIAVCTVAITMAEDMLLSCVLGFVIHYLFYPLANAIERTGISRRLSVSMLFLVTGLVIGCGLYNLLPELSAQVLSFKHDFPRYSAGISGMLEHVETSLNRVFPEMYKVDLSKGAETLMESASERVFQGLPGFVTTSLSVLLMAPLLAFFMLTDGQKAVKKLLEIVPNNLFEPALNLLYQINVQVGGFVRARLIESAIVGLVVWAGLVIVGSPYAFFFAVFAGLTNLIPYIGPVFGAVPAVLVAVINGADGVTILLILSVFGISQLIDNVVVVPMVVAKIVNLHAVVVIVVVIIGAQLGGILGMIISIPVTSILKLTLTAVYEHLTEIPVTKG